jgi:hypothetical protein
MFHQFLHLSGGAGGEMVLFLLSMNFEMAPKNKQQATYIVYST